MIGVITDFAQSTSIILWAVIFFFLIRRVNRLDKRLDQNSIAVAQVREGRYIQDPQPICGCGHHQCFHDETGCGNSEQMFDISQYKVVSCGCKRYTGPEPLPTFIP